MVIVQLLHDLCASMQRQYPDVAGSPAEKAGRPGWDGCARCKFSGRQIGESASVPVAFVNGAEKAAKSVPEVRQVGSNGGATVKNAYIYYGYVSGFTDTLNSIICPRFPVNSS